MREIPLTQGKIAIIDDSDYERVSKHKWCFNDRYVCRTKLHKDGSRERIYLHRFIMGAPKNKYVDHINHNTLDNRKENLRLCTNKQNQYNQKLRKGKVSKFKGVTKSSSGNWRVHIKQLDKGTFTNEIAAANAYNYYAKKEYGDFAWLNNVKFMSKDEWKKYRSKPKVAKKRSKYFGVTWSDRHNKWESKIKHKNKRIYLGWFSDEIEAAQAYDKKAIQLRGKDTKINFPKENYIENKQINIKM